VRKDRKGDSRKRFLMFLITVVSVAGMASIAVAASQDKYELPEPYLTWEKGFLQDFPPLQGLMDIMISTTVTQLKAPAGDILHNRVCSALAYEMAKTLSKDERKLAVATDIWPMKWRKHCPRMNGSWQLQRISSTISARRIAGLC
jgi:hypothetical protein